MQLYASTALAGRGTDVLPRNIDLIVDQTL